MGCRERFVCSLIDNSIKEQTSISPVFKYNNINYHHHHFDDDLQLFLMVEFIFLLSEGNA